MFITIDRMTQHISDIGGKMLLSTGNARIATAKEAAECLNRYTYLGNEKMHEANEDFKRIYYSPLSTNDVAKPVPNKAMKGFNARREAFEPSEQFANLFKDGEVL